VSSERRASPKPLQGVTRVALVMLFLPALGGAMLLFDKTDALRATDRLEAVLFHALPLALLFAINAYVWSRLARMRRLLRPGPGWRVLEGTTPAGMEGGAGELAIVTADGPRTVSLDKALMATDEVAEVLPTGPGRRGGIYYHHRIAPGAGVVVAGRFQPDERWLAAAGPGSLVLLACRPGRAPLATLGRALLWETLLLVELTLALALVMGLIVAGL